MKHKPLVARERTAGWEEPREVSLGVRAVLAFAVGLACARDGFEFPYTTLSGKARLVAQTPDAERAVGAWFTLSVCDIRARLCLVGPIGTGFCAFHFLDSTYAEELLRTLWTLSCCGAAAFRFLICPIATGIDAQRCDTIDTKGTVRALLTLSICNIRALNCLICSNNTRLKARCFLDPTYTEELLGAHGTLSCCGAAAF